MDIDILAVEFGPDHVHIFVGNCKNHSVPEDMAQRFKGYSSYVIRKEHRDSIKDKLWGSHFWSSGYFYEAVGRITSETTQFYIKRQQKKYWKIKNPATLPCQPVKLRSRISSPVTKVRLQASARGS